MHYSVPTVVKLSLVVKLKYPICIIQYPQFSIFRKEVNGKGYSFLCPFSLALSRRLLSRNFSASNNYINKRGIHDDKEE